MSSNMAKQKISRQSLESHPHPGNRMLSKAEQRTEMLLSLLCDATDVHSLLSPQSKPLEDTHQDYIKMKAF